MPKVLIADDHPLFRRAMAMALEGVVPGGPLTVLEAGCIADVQALAAEEPDLELLLLDLRMPGMDGFAGLLELRRRFPALPVVVVSAAEEPAVVRDALACGALGYIPKSLDRSQMAEALGRVLQGEIYVPPSLAEADGGGAAAPAAERLRALTPQQLNVLRLMVEGKPNKIIAYELDIAETTVKAHITVILRKLGVSSRTQAVLAARDLVGAAGVG
jgi:DNA-binding NarL/FixJ family response regulator